MNEVLQFLGDGLDAKDLTMLQVSLRAAIVFFATLVLVRVGSKRFFAKKTAFDFVVGLMLASLMVRAINGPERIVPTIAGGAVLIFLHRLLAHLAVKSNVLAGMVKGHSETLVEDGNVDVATLRRHEFGADDLEEELRLKGVRGPEVVALARLERNGEVSVIRKS